MESNHKKEKKETTLTNRNYANLPMRNEPFEPEHEPDENDENLKDKINSGNNEALKKTNIYNVAPTIPTVNKDDKSNNGSLTKKKSDLNSEKRNDFLESICTITEIQQIKKSLYKDSFFKNFYKDVTEEEAKKIYYTSILKLHEFKVSSCPEIPEHLNFCFSLDKNRVDLLKQTLKKYITNVNFLSVVTSLKEHIRNKFDFVEAFLKSSLDQIEVERENIKKLDLDREITIAKNSHVKIETELKSIKLDMQKRYGIQEEREMLKYKLWIELLRAIYHKELDFWIPLFRECYEKYKPDQLKKAVETAYEKFRELKQKYSNYEKDYISQVSFFQNVREYPIHAPNDLTRIFIDQHESFKKQISESYSNYTGLLDELFQFLINFLKIYFLVFYLNRLRIDKEKAVQNDFARINLMDQEKEITEKANFWFLSIEIKKTRLNDIIMHKINALIHSKNLCLSEIQNARINKMEDQIADLVKRINEIEYQLNQSNGFLGFLRNLKINPIRTIITKAASICVNIFAPGLGDIAGGLIDYGCKLFGANPPMPGANPPISQEIMVKSGVIQITNMASSMIANLNHDPQNRNRIMKNFEQDEYEYDNDNNNDPAAPVSIYYAEKFISEARWGAMKLFAGKQNPLEEDPICEMERENLKTGKIDFNKIYNFEKSMERTFPKDMENKLKAMELLKDIEKAMKFYSDYIEENLEIEKEKLIKTIEVYDRYNGMLNQMYSSDYASRLYKNRETMENFYYEKLLNQHSDFKKTNYSNILAQTEYLFSNEFISRKKISLNVLNDFANKIGNIAITGCCTALKNWLCGIYQMKFFQDNSVKIEEIQSLAVKKIRKRLKIKDGCCFKEVDRLKDLMLPDLINIACSKEFWSISKKCVKETRWECYNKFDIVTKQMKSPFSKKIFVDYDLNTHANNVNDFIYSIIMMDAYKISA
jgi:hypothetical protein